MTDIVIEVPASSLFDADKINNGIYVHLEGPEDEDGNTEPLYLGGDQSKPMRALVRSYRCQAVKDAEARLQTDGFTKVRKAPKKEKDRVISENSALPANQRFANILRGLENVSTGSGLIYLTPDQATKFFSNAAYAHFVEQINAVAYDDSKYRAGAGTEAGNSLASTSSTPSTTSPPSTSESNS